MQDSIVVVPAPGMGHLVSMVELGKLILHHYGNKFSITILITSGSIWDTPSTTSYIHQVSRSNPSISFHNLPSVSVAPTPARSPAAIGFEFIRLSLAHAPHALKQISNSSTIRALIVDGFCMPILPIVKDLKLPVYSFFTSGAFVLAVMLYFPSIHKQTTKSFKDLTTTEFHFPGMSSPLKATDMPKPILDRDDPAYWNMLYNTSHFPESDGIIVNTFEELEPNAIKVIIDGLCVPDSPTPEEICNGRRVRTHEDARAWKSLLCDCLFTLTKRIGPLIADAEEPTGEDGREGDRVPESDCLSWLESQPNRSVVFLCFGSQGTLSAAQVKEVAYGLEKSGQRFLWVVKKPPRNEKTKQAEKYATEFDLEDILPEGFLERTKSRGMVLKTWAPKVAVLRKESVGGFITHCGWNSVLEAVVAGVPMVAWPLYSEQHLNRHILVHDMKMAIDLEQREDDGFVSGNELEKKVRELMESEQGKELRERSYKMKEMASAALGSKSGSSMKALTKLFEAL